MNDFDTFSDIHEELRLCRIHLTKRMQELLELDSIDYSKIRSFDSDEWIAYTKFTRLFEQAAKEFLVNGYSPKFENLMGIMKNLKDFLPKKESE